MKLLSFTSPSAGPATDPQGPSTAPPSVRRPLPRRVAPSRGDRPPQARAAPPPPAARDSSARPGPHASSPCATRCCPSRAGRLGLTYNDCDGQRAVWVPVPTAPPWDGAREDRSAVRFPRGNAAVLTLGLSWALAPSKELNCGARERAPSQSRVEGRRERACRRW